ncbi:MAG: hypothetical protein ACRDFA_10930 [bacterium]
MSGFQPKRWQRGEKLTAARLNEPVDSLIAISGGAPPPVDIPGQKVGVTFQQFAVREVKSDYLICHALTLSPTGETVEGTQDIKVAKPYLLRRSITQRTTTAGLVLYTYQSDTQRTATLGAQSETQKITPEYGVGDVILAVRGILGGTLVKVDGVPLQFMDMTPRAWAKSA